MIPAQTSWQTPFRWVVGATAPPHGRAASDDEKPASGCPPPAARHLAALRRRCATLQSTLSAALPVLAWLQLPNVRYLQIAAEFLSEHLPPRSVDLIAMAETLHWCVGRVRAWEQGPGARGLRRACTHPFHTPARLPACRIDHITFYEQARRVLKPTGAMVIWWAPGR